MHTEIPVFVIYLFLTHNQYSQTVAAKKKWCTFNTHHTYQNSILQTSFYSLDSNLLLKNRNVTIFPTSKKMWASFLTVSKGSLCAKFSGHVLQSSVVHSDRRWLYQKTVKFIYVNVTGLFNKLYCPRFMIHEESSKLSRIMHTKERDSAWIMIQKKS